MSLLSMSWGSKRKEKRIIDKDWGLLKAGKWL